MTRKAKKITRGISPDFAEAFKKCELYDLYKEHGNELFLGVRNNYLNLYYNCDSIAKIEYKRLRGSKELKFVCEINKYYSGNESNKITLQQICKEYSNIKQKSNDRVTQEKKAQSQLVLLNNANSESNWYCIDVEYVKQYRDQKEKDAAGLSGRFDIIAVSKTKPHRVALIELKYGGGAMGGSSGVYKHVEDFSKFCDGVFFDGHLRGEIVEIIESLISLGVAVPFAKPDKTDLLAPEFYFITLDNNAHNGNTPKQTMAGYLFKDSRWGCTKLSTKYCAEADFGDITKKSSKFHATFLFSKDELKNISITDIIDDQSYERIIPE